MAARQDLLIKFKRSAYFGWVRRLKGRHCRSGPAQLFKWNKCHKYGV